MAAGRRSMVCRRMGLLDDAIREHLELKRLRGADPGLVAREEHEAFGPVRTGDAPASADDDGSAPVELDEPTGEDVTWIDDDRVPESRLDDAQEDDAPEDQVQTGHAQMDVAPLEDAHAEDAQDFSSVGQETAELDMRAVLEEADHDHGPVDGHGHDHDPAPAGRDDDALGEAAVEEPSELPARRARAGAAVRAAPCAGLRVR